MNIRLKRTPGIYVVGFMASGKTTIGRRAAARLGWTFADLDDDIEAGQQMPIPGIFAARGEREFRRIENEALRARLNTIASGHSTVLAVGGGAFVEPANYDLLQANGVSVWLDCPLEVARRRVEQATHRPLARDPATFARLYEERLPFYRRADFRVAVGGDDPDPAVEAILALPIFR